MVSNKAICVSMKSSGHKSRLFTVSQNGLHMDLNILILHSKPKLSIFIFQIYPYLVKNYKITCYSEHVFGNLKFDECSQHALPV